MRIWTTAVATVAALAFAGFAQAQEYPEMTLKIAHFVPANITGSKIDKWFADEVKRRSGGKIKIHIFWSESMGKANELLDLVGSGAVDEGPRVGQAALLGVVEPAGHVDRLRARSQRPSRVLHSLRGQAGIS